MPRADCRMAPMHRSLPNKKRHVTARREVSSSGYIFIGYIYRIVLATIPVIRSFVFRQ